MSDYISRKAAIEAFENADADVLEDYGDGACDWGFGMKNIQEVLNSVPTADVEPVRPMGMMRYNRIFDWQQCSVCGATINSTIYVSEDYNLDGEIHFCPRCGAKMNLEDENE